jgi:hypothetical protein
MLIAKKSINKFSALSLLLLITILFLSTTAFGAEPIKVKVDLFYSEISLLVMKICGLDTENYHNKYAAVMREIENTVNGMEGFRVVGRDDKADINVFVLVHREKDTFIIDLVSKKTGRGVNSKPIHFYELSCDSLGNFLAKKIKDGLPLADQIIQPQDSKADPFQDVEKGYF